MKKFLLVLSVLILIGVSITPTKAYCADHVINFTVTDSIGNPIVGAMIKIEGTVIGVTTDVNGNATLTIPSAYWNTNLVVTVSCITFITEEYSYNDLLGHSHIDVVLEDAPLLLRLYQKFIELF